MFGLLNSFRKKTLSLFLYFHNVHISRVWIWSQPSRSRPGRNWGSEGSREPAIPLQVDDGGTIVS